MADCDCKKLEKKISFLEKQLKMLSERLTLIEKTLVSR